LHRYQKFERDLVNFRINANAVQEYPLTISFTPKNTNNFVDVLHGSERHRRVKGREGQGMAKSPARSYLKRGDSSLARESQAVRDALAVFVEDDRQGMPQ